MSQAPQGLQKTTGPGGVTPAPALPPNRESAFLFYRAGVNMHKSKQQSRVHQPGQAARPFRSYEPGGGRRTAHQFHPTTPASICTRPLAGRLNICVRKATGQLEEIIAIPATLVVPIYQFLEDCSFPRCELSQGLYFLFLLFAGNIYRNS